jgi:hypothetical protein
MTMPKINNDINIVEALRTKTEETDMNQYLKSTLGGYTKGSVLEYLNILRKRHQAMADTFSQNQQALFEEKKSILKDNDALKIGSCRLNPNTKTFPKRCAAMKWSMESFLLPVF